MTSHTVRFAIGIVIAACALTSTSAFAQPPDTKAALRTSYDKVRQALSALSAADLGATVKVFGRDTTKQGAVMMILLEQHEHLGQSIAYARSNGVVPPWSK
jgi:uncharacterized damage-inducible protein DinB